MPLARTAHDALLHAFKPSQASRSLAALGYVESPSYGTRSSAVPRYMIIEMGRTG